MNKFSSEVLVIIPARAGSKGVPRKNIQLIGKKPMIQFTMEAAQGATKISNVIVSSDDPEVIKLAKQIGIKVPFTRPRELSTDSAKTSDVIKHALNWYHEENNVYTESVMLLQPTSPFRTSEDIDQAVKLFREGCMNTLVSVCEPMQHPNDCIVQNKRGGYDRVEVGKIMSDNVSGRQTFTETLFIDGAIYLSTVENFLDTHDMIGTDPGVIKLHQSHSIDIDTLFDLELARSMHQSGMVD